MIGPGKYDHLVTYCRRSAHAQGAILIIVGGNKGHGFSCQADITALSILPDMLEEMARQIRADMAGGNA